MTKTPECQERHGWEPKPSGEGCRRTESSTKDSLRLDEACGQGWKGTKGNCKRNSSGKSNSQSRKTILVAGALIGVTGLALTGAAMKGRKFYEVNRKQPSPKPSFPEQRPLSVFDKVNEDVVSEKGISEIFDWAIDNGTPLTQAEKEAIDNYRGSGYREINNRLKGRNVDNPALIDKDIADLDKAMDKLPPFSGENAPIGETYRAQGDDYVSVPVLGKVDRLIRVSKASKEKILSSYQKGDVIKEDGYLSTSTFLSKSKMDVFAGFGNPNHDATVVYEINWKGKDTAARWITESTSVASDENEVLFKKGTRFRVSSVQENNYKLRTQYGYKIILEEL